MTDWRILAERARELVGTPCYVMLEWRIREALADLNALESSVRLRQWLSLKTQPVARLVDTAAGLGLGIDVVSEFELAGAISAGVPAHRILVNGVGKHHWLHRCRVPGLSVHFDSIAEVEALAELARTMGWRVGLRCAIPKSNDVNLCSDSLGWDQFGMTEAELRAAVVKLADAGVAVSGLHFHLHTSMHHVTDYRHAFGRLANAARTAGIIPEYLDIGGGLPIAGETPLDGPAAADTFEFGEYREFLASIPSVLPSVREVWLENGRFLTGPAGALVMTVLDRKERGDGTYLICDGGRVNHARMASIEKHEILLAPVRAGPVRKTVVCGPTCSAVDQLGCWMLPVSVEPGDRVIWLNAGAYHIPLETRFSTGLAPVVWFNGKHEPEIVRKRETPVEWWGRWISRDEKTARIPQLMSRANGGR
jgi:diaminopimelate decarboxylase